MLQFSCQSKHDQQQERATDIYFTKISIPIKATTTCWCGFNADISNDWGCVWAETRYNTPDLMFWSNSITQTTRHSFQFCTFFSFLSHPSAQHVFILSLSAILLFLSKNIFSYEKTPNRFELSSWWRSARREARENFIAIRKTTQMCTMKMNEVISSAIQASRENLYKKETSSNEGGSLSFATQIRPLSYSWSFSYDLMLYVSEEEKRIEMKWNSWAEKDEKSKPLRRR